MASKEVVIEILYLAYTISESRYIFSSSLIRCIKCIHYNIHYNRNFSIDDFDYLIVK
jgi:hypothetical protein